MINFQHLFDPVVTEFGYQSIRGDIHAGGVVVIHSATVAGPEIATPTAAQLLQYGAVAALPSFLSIGHHFTDGYTTDLGLLWSFASTPGNLFHGSPVALAMTQGVPYLGARTQILPGTAQNDNLDVFSADNFVLGGGGDDRVSISLGALAQPAGGRFLDGGDNSASGMGDVLWLPGARSDYQALIANGAELIYQGGTTIGTINGFETVVFAGSGELLALDARVLVAETATPGAPTFTLTGSGDYADAGDGDQTIVGTANADIVRFGNGQKTISSGGGNDILVFTGAPSGGGSASLALAVVTIGGGNYIDGGEGADLMQGGGGDDTYVVDNAGDMVVEYTNGGADLVIASVDYALAENVEHLTLTGAAIAAVGNALANTLRGNDSANALYGGAGDDALHGGDGDDVLDGGLGVDTINGGAGNDTILYAIGDGNGSMNGDDGTDALSVTDGAADSILNTTWNGAALSALSGNPLTSIETITANLGGGIDWLVYAAGSAAVTVNLATNSASGFFSISNIERVVGGAANDALTGNGLDNRLDGGAGDDVLAGGGGIDTLIGGDGADTLSGGLSNDSIQAGAGNDTINWSVGDGRDTIDGGADFDTFDATGSTSAELGNATWNGSSLTALMDNGLSNIEAINLNLGDGVDWLIYNASAAVIVNLATHSASGFASVTNVEKVIGGSGADTLTGDGLDNRLDGQGGNDALDGGAGSDQVLGGDGDDVIYASAGNDSLQGQNGADTFYWTAEDGRDTFNGGTGVDTVYLTGAAVADVADAKWNGTAITGLLNNAFIDIEAIHLDLGAGGPGGDWLRYTTTFGVSVDLSTGIATGFASVTGVENLIGGSGADTLIGDAGANKINGADGDDRIEGGAGNDNLTGGAGSDTFVYAPGCGNDTINDFDAWEVGGQDYLDVSAFGIDAGNFAARVAIIDVGADTVIRIDDAHFITLKNVTGDGDNVITQADFFFGS